MTERILEDSGPVLASGDGKVSRSPHVLPWVATWVLLVSLAAVGNAILIYFSGGRSGYLLLFLAANLTLLAALFDGWTQRIPNPLTYTAILLGLALNACAWGADSFHVSSVTIWLGSAGFLSSLGGFLVCAILGLMGSFVAGVHGGDLKLLAALGALVGFEAVCAISLIALVFALAYAIVNLILLGRLNMVLRLGAQRLLEWFYLRRFHTPLPETTRATHTPMAIPLAIAAVMVLVMQARGTMGGLI